MNSNASIIDLKTISFEMNEIFMETIGYAMYKPNIQKIENFINEIKKINEKHFFAYVEKGKILGVIVIHNQINIEILNIGVLSSERKKGVGKKLIEYVHQNNVAKIIEAETDKGAVGFYKSIGFSIIELGEKYPGVSRYRCILN